MKFTLQGKSSKFARETLDFAIEKKADLILITTTKNISVADYLLGAPEQYIIANSNRIPVMCVNPRAAYINVGQFMWGSRYLLVHAFSPFLFL